MSTSAQIAQSTLSVILRGETGTGKEVVARAIHALSPRAARPILCVNCGAIPANLVESTLFGHERGAFSGAIQLHRGVFEAADGGTVFLDELGELPLPVQAALLRVLEAKTITRVGSTKEIPVDVRLIAATHRDLEAMSKTGAFRSDLFFRLAGDVIVIPPLRERPEEIEPLALHFLASASRASGRYVTRIDPGATALLQAYAWPGNIRELCNAITRAVTIADGDAITEDDLPDRVRAAASPAADADGERASGEWTAPVDSGDDLRSRLRRCEIEMILEALRASGGNQTAAARRLGLPLRTLVYKLRTLEIKRLGFAAE